MSEIITAIIFGEMKTAWETYVVSPFGGRGGGTLSMAVQLFMSTLKV